MDLKKLINKLINDTMENTLLWNLPEIKQIEDELAEIKKLDGPLGFLKSPSQYKLFRKKAKTLRKRLRKLDHSNAKLFRAKLAITEAYYPKLYSVTIEIKSEEIIMAIVDNGYAFNENERLEYGTVCLSSDLYPELVMFPALLRHPSSISLTENHPYDLFNDDEDF